MDVYQIVNEIMQNNLEVEVYNILHDMIMKSYDRKIIECREKEIIIKNFNPKITGV